MARYIAIKKIFYFFLIFIYSILFITLAIFFIEIFDIGTKLLKKTQDRALHTTNYYGKPLDFNPYQKFDKKFLHPYLTFSMPVVESEIQKINNEFVSLNENGFRINPLNKHKSYNNGVLLGGSTAFGYYSSQDEKTIAALITQKTKYNIYNLNGPSWNSHQELVALLKFNKDYKMSIALSANNDFSIFCSKSIDTEYEKNYIDIVESYVDINKVFKSLVDKRIYHMDYKTVIKYFIVNNFPESLNVINYFKFNKKKNLPTQTNITRSKCLDEKNSIRYDKLDKSIDQFIKNHELMRVISKSRDAEHYLFLQPSYILQSPSEIKLSEESYLKSQIIEYSFNKIMNSNFCKENCFDFSKLFKDKNINTYSYMDNHSGSYKNEVFIDNIHLSDIGNEIVTNEMLNKIDF